MWGLMIGCGWVRIYLGARRGGSPETDGQLRYFVELSARARRQNSLRHRFTWEKTDPRA